MVAESLALMPLRARDNIPRIKAERNKLVFILLVKVEGQAGHERIVGGKQLRSGVAVRQNADASVRGSKNLNDNIINALARLSGKYFVKERLYLILAPYLQKLFELIDGLFGIFKLVCALALLVVDISDVARAVGGIAPRRDSLSAGKRQQRRIANGLADADSTILIQQLFCALHQFNNGESQFC